MRGKNPAPKRKITPDPKFGSVLVSKFINHIMKDGKKATAQKVFYSALDIIKAKSQRDPLDVFDIAVRNIAPEVEVKSRRVGGANYQVPIYVSEARKTALAFRWLVAACAAKKGAPMGQKLATEILEASENLGTAIKKKQDVYKMAQANRAFAHFAR